MRYLEMGEFLNLLFLGLVYPDGVYILLFFAGIPLLFRVLIIVTIINAMALIIAGRALLIISRTSDDSIFYILKLKEYDAK